MMDEQKAREIKAYKNNDKAIIDHYTRGESQGYLEAIEKANGLVESVKNVLKPWTLTGLGKGDEEVLNNLEKSLKLYQKGI